MAERTVSGQLRRAGLHRAALKAAPKAYGRYEAERANERWVTDVLVGPWVPYPRRDGSARARLFLIVDDHSRLLVDGRFYDRENARICQELLRRAITRRGVPDVLYADNGAPFANAWLARTCAVLGIRLIHSKPYSPQGRGKQERATGISGKRSWPRRAITGSSRWTSSTTGSPRGPSRSPTGGCTPRPGRRPSTGSRRPARTGRQTRR